MTGGNSISNPILERAMRAKQARAAVAPVAVEESTPKQVRVSSAKKRPLRHLLPSAEELMEWIEQATKALSRGVVWERGSILNIEV